MEKEEEKSDFEVGRLQERRKMHKAPNCAHFNVTLKVWRREKIEQALHQKCESMLLVILSVFSADAMNEIIAET